MFIFAETMGFLYSFMMNLVCSSLGAGLLIVVASLVAVDPQARKTPAVSCVLKLVLNKKHIQNLLEPGSNHLTNATGSIRQIQPSHWTTPSPDHCLLNCDLKSGQVQLPSLHPVQGG